MAPPLLNLDGIQLTFGGTPLLDGASLIAGDGDRIALVGRNGSGKSTLLKIAAGLTEAQGGSVFLQPGATLRYLEQAPDMAGYPHVTVPAGFCHGLPVALSFFGKAWQDGKLLGYAFAFEQATQARRAPAFKPTVA